MSRRVPNRSQTDRMSSLLASSPTYTVKFLFVWAASEPNALCRNLILYAGMTTAKLLMPSSFSANHQLIAFPGSTDFGDGILPDIFFNRRSAFRRGLRRGAGRGTARKGGLQLPLYPIPQSGCFLNRNRIVQLDIDIVNNKIVGKDFPESAKTPFLHMERVVRSFVEINAGDGGRYQKNPTPLQCVRYPRQKQVDIGNMFDRLEAHDHVELV